MASNRQQPSAPPYALLTQSVTRRMLLAQHVTDALVSEAHRCREGAGGEGPVSSDDLLPLLIATLIQACLV